MKKTLFSTAFVVTIVLFVTTTSCTKEVISKTQSFDTLAIAKKLFIGKWDVLIHEREQYAGGQMIDKRIFNFANTNTSVEIKKDYTTNSIFQGSPAGGGTWQMISPQYFVLDKGDPANERFYYIIVLDNRNLITRGPYNANGGLIDSFLYTFYYKRNGPTGF